MATKREIDEYPPVADKKKQKKAVRIPKLKVRQKDIEWRE